MNLGELIRVLNALIRVHPNAVLDNGFENAHSYRGSYDQLAFEPAYRVSVADMLATAEGAEGMTYGGWKGGEFTMSALTPVNIAEEGCTHDEPPYDGFAPFLADVAMLLVFPAPEARS